MEFELVSGDTSPDGKDDPFVDADILTNVEPTNELTCQVCGIGLHYGGRGRKPKFCAEHKPKPATSTSAKGSNVDSLITQIGELYMTLGAGLTFIPPTAVDGMIISEHANRMAESWRSLILRDPKIRKFWEKMTTGGGWGQVMMAHGVVAMAIMQTHNVQLPGLSGVKQQ